MSSSFFVPEWPVPRHVRSCVSTRVAGENIGVSTGESASSYGSNNMGLHVGDRPEHVEANRQHLLSAQENISAVQWLEQVHGTRVVEALPDGRVRTADGCFTQSANLACAVMTADCLPILLCDQQGTQVAAIHAGWRGLANGILRSALTSFTAPRDQILVYLGPAISQTHFEVGVEVLEAFFESSQSTEQAEAISAAFRPAQKPLHFYADIAALARAELAALGVTAVYGGDDCTYAEAERFYSYRRDGQTGRMASLIWMEGR